MIQAAQTYWDEFWKGKDKPTSVSAWMFGGLPDELAQLVIDGKKTATCSGHVIYGVEDEPFPKTEDYSIILNKGEQPVAIIKTVEVSFVQLNKVTEEFAISEGEGSYEDWKSIHERFFTSELQNHGLEFSEDMLLVCERFTLIDVKDQ
ncbi:ASCH domain-containing protein [Sporosarcina sp. E16_8]|uniref:ASCH domain-containing protein n=1 Tax=Sporosarcina sp. E16_8 TaxID=2789295 RepID=UPI001A91D484|nr:ASCH domain-containing protein [Sporosarcina sp. E16_8]